MRLTDAECRSLLASASAAPRLVAELMARIDEDLAKIDPLDYLPPIEAVAARYLAQRDLDAARLQAERYGLSELFDSAGAEVPTMHHQRRGAA